ncbi:DUF5949 family protein [Streptomyces sp. NPDC091272]|uniref:DUF5949 family protein n=1 Tax=Streptomyces sp. NPDC091272 TaxID=3365981 RepID=UPI003819C19D
MTSTQTNEITLNRAHLGSIGVLAWAGENADDGRDAAFLLAYPLGDGEGSAEEGEQAVRTMLAQAGLPVGGAIVNGALSSVPLSLVVQGSSAVLTLPLLNATCTAPPEWLAAADKRGQVHLMFTTRTWPEAKPGEPVTEESLHAFVGDEETIRSAAHCRLPADRLRS